ncbi:hypothetical protein ACROYT_G005359 [Oculina patagonica]
MKRRTRMGTWNVHTLYETGRATQVANEMRQYNTVVFAICESRWNGAGQKGHHHQNCYAPTNTAADDQKDEFYSSLQGVLDHITRRDIKILLGDFNAKIGPDNTGKEMVMGCHGLGCMSENGERFTDFCAFNDLVIGESIFPHRAIHKATWISPDGRMANQIDHITIARKWKPSLLDMRVKRGADIASDHHLLLGTFKVKLRVYCDSSARPHCKYNILNLTCSETAKMFNCTVKNKFSALEFVDDDLNNHWAGLKKTWQESCNELSPR